MPLSKNIFVEIFFLKTLNDLKRANGNIYFEILFDIILELDRSLSLYGYVEIFSSKDTKRLKTGWYQHVFRSFIRHYLGTGPFLTVIRICR